MQISQLDIEKVQAILFDLDGTLYDLKAMQKIMRKKILFHLLTKPWKWKEILIVYYFRKDRKDAAGAYVPDLKITQYRWLQRRFDLSLKNLESIIEKWMYELPAKQLADLAFPNLYSFLDVLKAKAIPFGIHSDLQIGKKLECLNIQPDCQSDATDADINSLKPHPGGIFAFAKKLEIKEENILVLGDKEKLDGRMAREGGSLFVHIQNHRANQQYQMLTDLFEQKVDPEK
ncbi:MAG: HAD family hydrolase [Bacteroidia bacterium]|nr:HAD family hydrolase [Bacteroidia bacterium]